MNTVVSKKPKTTIGRAEEVLFPELFEVPIHARIDSGARTSAVWASYASEEDGKLAVVFLGPSHTAYTGEKVYFTIYSRDIVTSSTGHREERYKIKLLVVLYGRKVRASFTLANRGTQVYPILIGRNVLRGKFIVDVSKGRALKEEERALLARNRQELQKGV